MINDKNTKHVYYIGGSTCCGKSTIAEMLVKEFGYEYFKCDEYVGDYIERGANEDNPLMLKLKNMTLDELYLGRSVEEQINDELAFYKESLEMLLEDIDNLKADNIIVEGVNITPDIASEYGFKNYVAMVPSKKFQLDHFKDRKWVQEILQNCSNEKEAYFNLMDRDIQMALEIVEQAEQNKKPYIVIDGTLKIEEVYNKVKKLLKI